MKNEDHSKQSKPQKALSKSKNEKPLSLKSASAASVMKKKDGKDVEGTSTSNGSVGLISHPKQPSKSRSFNGRQVQLSNIKFHIVLLQKQEPTLNCLASVAWPYFDFSIPLLPLHLG